MSNPLAELLFKEVEDSFETIRSIADQYGVDTLVDLWWLGGVLAKGEGYVAQNYGSQLDQVLEQLPSGKLFLQYVDTEFCKN